MSKRPNRVRKKNQPPIKKVQPRRLSIKTARASKLDMVKSQSYEIDLQLSLIERTWQLWCLGYYDREIIEVLVDEFKLTSKPVASTLNVWREIGKQFKTAGIKKHQEDYINRALGVVDMMLKKWAQIALLPNLQIQRTKVVNGEKITYIDEDAYDEQIKAGQLVVKLLKEGRDILGIGNHSAEAQLEGVDRNTLLVLVQSAGDWIKPAGKPNGGAIDVTSEVLELDSGVRTEL